MFWSRDLEPASVSGDGPPRHATGGLPVPPEPVIHLVTAPEAPPSVRDLKHAQEQYEQALHGFEIRFDPPGPTLAGKRYLEQPPETVHQHLGKLRERVGELTDWIDYRHLPDRFAHLGLRAFWDNLQQAPPPPDQVVDVFHKSFWSSWIEAVFQQDPELSGFRRVEHEQLVADFRALDKELILPGPARVTQRRPPDESAPAFRGGKQLALQGGAQENQTSAFTPAF